MKIFELKQHINTIREQIIKTKNQISEKEKQMDKYKIEMNYNRNTFRMQLDNKDSEYRKLEVLCNNLLQSKSLIGKEQHKINVVSLDEIIEFENCRTIQNNYKVL